jgi:hypothetical protein
MPKKSSPKADKIKEPPVLGPRGRQKRVRPLNGQPETGRAYDPGFAEPPERTPWQDEGHPETNG